MGQTYKVVFTRPWKYSQLGNIKVEIDGSSTKYDLRNGKSFEVRLPEGSHSVKFTSFMVAAKSEMKVNIDRDRTFSVAPAKTIYAAPGLIPMVALQVGKPLVKVTDENGLTII